MFNEFCGHLTKKEQDKESQLQYERSADGSRLSNAPNVTGGQIQVTATVEPKKAKGILIKNSAFTTGVAKNKAADKENLVKHDPPKVLGYQRQSSKGIFAKVNFKRDSNSQVSGTGGVKETDKKSEALKIAPQASQPSQRLQRLKPQSLNRNDIAASDNRDDVVSPSSVFTLNSSKPQFITQKSTLKKQGTMQTATHRYDPNGRANFMMAPESALTPGSAVLFKGADESAALPLGSGIPKLNPIKINQAIEDSNKVSEKHQQRTSEVKSPLTAFNIREKAYKNRSLSGTYGKEYQDQTKRTRFEELDDSRQQEMQREKQRIQDQIDMRECIGDVLTKMNRESALPDSYLYQPETAARKWMLQRGKKRLALYDDDTETQMRKYFKQLTVDGKDKVGAGEIEELLITFGLVQTREEVDQLISEITFDGNDELDFDEFLALLKGIPGRFSNSRRSNFLNQRNIMFEEQNELDDITLANQKSKLGKLLPPIVNLKKIQDEDIREVYTGHASENFQSSLRTVDKTRDVRSKDPREIGRRQQIADMIARRKKQSKLLQGQLSDRRSQAQSPQTVEVTSVKDDPEVVSLQHSESVQARPILGQVQPMACLQPPRKKVLRKKRKFNTSHDVSTVADEKTAMKSELGGASSYQGSYANQSQASSQLSRPSNLGYQGRSKQVRKEISNFFYNLTKKRSKSGDGRDNIPFSLLIGNFRRKKILETLKQTAEGKITYEEGHQILRPYEEYIERLLDSCMDVQEKSGLDLFSESRGPAGETGTTFDNEENNMGEGILGHRAAAPTLAEKRVCEEIREQDSSDEEYSPIKDAKVQQPEKQREIKKLDIAKLREKIEQVTRAPNFEELSAAARNASIILGPKISVEATEAEETLKNKSLATSSHVSSAFLSTTKDAEKKETAEHTKTFDSYGAFMNRKFAPLNLDQASVSYLQSSGIESARYSRMSDLISPRFAAYNQHRMLQQKQLKLRFQELGASEDILTTRDSSIKGRIMAEMQEKGLLGKSEVAVAFKTKNKKFEKQLDDKRSCYSAIYKDQESSTSYFEASDPAKVFEEILRK